MKFNTRFRHQTSPSLCVVCGTFNDAVSKCNSDNHFMTGLGKMMNWNGCGRKRLVTSWRECLGLRC